MAKFYTDSSGRRRPISQSLFRPAKDKALAKRISIVNPHQARESVHYLNERYDHSDSHAERVKLVRAANSAANRADVLGKSEERDIYRGFVDAHKGKE